VVTTLSSQELAAGTAQSTRELVCRELSLRTARALSTSSAINMAVPLPLLLSADGAVCSLLALLLLLCPHLAAQPLFFLGDAIPWPVPWAGAPFDRYVTQKGLDSAWPSILSTLRLGAVTLLLFGLAVAFMGRTLMQHFRIHEEYLAKKGRRGEAVHNKVRTTMQEATEYVCGRTCVEVLKFKILNLFLVISSAGGALRDAKPWPRA
jgi:hypothetical protein